MTAASDARWMRLALGLGRRGMGQVWPNPAVGCVIVRDGRVVGRGWTQPGGRPHAETEALAQAGARAEGATAYVSLEPCAHHGKTPPCAEALVASGVARVVTALGDPDPRVAGGGHNLLRAAGVEVTEHVCAAEASLDHRGFLSRVTQGRPFLTLKLAMSLDGRIATASGESQWITGPAARRMVHVLRARHDAVMVGGGTARADDPTLTVRDMGIARQPVRVVVTSGLDMPHPSRLSETVDQGPVWILHGSGAPLRPDVTDSGVRLLEVPMTAPGRLDLSSVVQVLASEGLTRVFCEGGGELAAGLLRAGLVDEIVVFSAGLALGAEGRSGLGAMGLEALAEAPRFDLADVVPVGPDTMSVWRRP